MANPPYGPPMVPGNPSLLERLHGTGDSLLRGLSEEELAHIDEILGLGAPPTPDLTQETLAPQTGGQQFVQGFAGLENQPQGPARGFGQGLVQGLSRGLGAAGSRIEAQRAKLEAGVEQRSKERAAANQRATELYNARKSGGRQAYLMARINADLNPREPSAPIAIQTPQGPRYVSRGEAVGKQPAEAAAGAEPLVQIEGPNGPVYVRRSEALGKSPPKPEPKPQPVRGTDRQALAYYQRAQDAINNINTTDAAGTSLENRVALAPLPGQAQLRYAPNFLKSSDQKLYRQAQRAFTEARLRKESGAAIPPHEYEADAATYFAQPGDDAATIRQKQQARNAVLTGLANSSGKAYEEYYGEPYHTGEAVRGPDGKLVLRR